MSDYRCPICGGDTKVTRTTVIGGTTARRQRLCADGHRFETSETPLTPDWLVRRSDDRIEPFDRRHRLERSIRKAGSGILTDRHVATVADAVVTRLDPQPRTPVSTEDIGNAVLLELRTTSVTSALRYATIFLSKRGQIHDAADLAEWIRETIGPARRTRIEPDRPLEVVKRRRAGDQADLREDFQLVKLWAGLEAATAGLGFQGDSYDPVTYSHSLGAIAAAVLDDVRGQPIVTSGQLSAAALRVLRSVSPLGYLRFSIVAKGYSGTQAFLDECDGLTEVPGAPIDLSDYADQGAALAKEVAAWRQRRTS